MKLYHRLLHLPTKTTYRVGKLVSQSERNQAFELLYRTYVGDQCRGTPWQFDKSNPSGIHVEERYVDGKWKNILLDRHEHSSIIAGVVRENDGKLVATTRLLRRQDMEDGKLEMERYETLPNEIRNLIEVENCNMELNRFAVDPSVSKNHCVTSTCLGLMTNDVTNKTDNVIWSTFPAFVSSLKATDFVVGKFKYEENDPGSALVCKTSPEATSMLAMNHLLSGGNLPIPNDDYIVPGGGVVREGVDDNNSATSAERGRRGLQKSLLYSNIVIP